MGQPTSRRSPKTGCGTSTTIARARVCSPASASSTEWTGATGTWPGAAEARQRAADDARVRRAQRRVVETKLRGQVTAQVRVDGVGARDEPVEQRAALGRTQVERQAARAAVERLVVEAVGRG